MNTTLTFPLARRCTDSPYGRAQFRLAEIFAMPHNRGIV